jgi:hypothetical protein
MSYRQLRRWTYEARAEGPDLVHAHSPTAQAVLSVEIPGLASNFGGRQDVLGPEWEVLANCCQVGEGAVWPLVRLRAFGLLEFIRSSASQECLANGGKPVQERAGFARSAGVSVCNDSIFGLDAGWAARSSRASARRATCWP